MDRLLDALPVWRDLPVVVVGDVILDTYVRGRVDRISPEAPVPVVRKLGEEDRPGGAANVAANVAALSARPRLVAFVGDDDGGRALRQELSRWGVPTGGLLELPGRPTTRKTRVLAQNQQVLRLDREEDGPVATEHAERLVAEVARALDGARGLVVSDYAKGALDDRTLPAILEAAAERGVPSVVDPKLRHFSQVRRATVITPNQAETGAATARVLQTEQDVLIAAEELLERLEPQAIVVTRGEHGMLVVSREGEPVWIPARAREVYDVTGAGDTVTAVLGVALSSGMPLADAARLANAAASIAVARLGTAAVTVEELRGVLDAS
jgi:D-beta-D-heptose 7-phosphate kinase/D-beta-D-heptose 1-phosphate adenosyltransferase